MTDQPDLPRRKAETIIVDQHQDTLAMIDGAFLWPPTGAIVELGNPNRDAVVREVRLRLHLDYASVIVSVYDRGEIVPPTSEGGE